MELRVRNWDWNIAFRDFWRKHEILCALLLAALIFDTLTTIRFMEADGIQCEIHPLVRASAALLGPIPGAVLSAFFFKAVTGIILAFYLRRFSTWVLVIPIITATIAGFINLFTCGAAPYPI